MPHRKYHTYPRSRIPLPRRRLTRPHDPRMYPLEPREVDLEAFQQLHTADSQEELQEFLLLESQCSGHLGLGTATSASASASASELSFGGFRSEDDRGTVSDY
ncbi:uncharacterized protein LOC105702951 [Orussus abietinus]|uniref:uncharacterized protein LOC105702951 n=1 Tax=Orussus abietinus TaxID=222816 RepID=UPI000626D0FB|nr:uncharacterized protein LOC105702951 [Orussus abietinus]